MDPTISMLLAALAAGATAAAKDTASAVVKDGYAGLKALLKRKFVAKPMALAAVDAHASDTAVAEPVLRAAMAEAAVGSDAALIEAAKQLLAQADPEGRVAARYSVNITGNVTGWVNHNQGTVNMNFGKPD